MNPKTCLPTEFSPMKTGGAKVEISRKDCKGTWTKHNFPFSYRHVAETSSEIAPHFLHENCHLIGRNQKPQTRVVDGQ